MKMDVKFTDVQRTEEPIYDKTSQVATQQAIQQISEKYDSLGLLKEKMETLSVASVESGDGRSAYPPPDEVSDQDVMQVEMFFQSQKTSVFVCPSLVNLYLTEPTNVGEEPQWTLKCTGIPVLLLDKGDTRPRNQRRIQLVLAERGTGFVLWKDVIDNLTNYSARDDNFHRFYLSWDHRCQAGLSFDNCDAAKELLKRIEVLTSDPSNISLSGPSSKHRKQPKKTLQRVKLPKKADISQPCCFQHVTRVDLGDKANYFSLSTLTPEGNL